MSWHTDRLKAQRRAGPVVEKPKAEKKAAPKKETVKKAAPKKKAVAKKTSKKKKVSN